MSEKTPDVSRSLPEIYDDRRGGWRVPTRDEMIDRIKGALVSQFRMKGGDARKRARALVFGFENGTVPYEEINYFC
ncbi:MAG: hypothetical protein WC880_03025 [Candidatus Paceibacterota bacterium]